MSTVLQIVFLTLLHDANRIKTNITHTPGDRMVSVVEHLCVGYYDAISKKKVRAHVNERNVVNSIMSSAVTTKLRHVSSDKSLVNPYEKPQRLINRLIELFSNANDWVLDLFSGTRCREDFRQWHENCMEWTKSRRCNVKGMMVTIGTKWES